MNTIFLFSGESLVYGFDDLTGSLQLSHKLVLSSKDYPGILVKYCQHFNGGFQLCYSVLFVNKKLF